MLPAAELTPDSIAQANETTKIRIDAAISLAQAVQTDPDEKTRLSMALCRCCFYLRKDRIGGARITQRPCAGCQTEMTFGSTATDALCESCAKEKHLCKRCTCSLDIK